MKYEPIEVGSVAGSPAVWAGNTLYLSGLPGLKLEEGAVAGEPRRPGPPDGPNHVAILEAAGLRLEDIVSGCVYLRDMKDYDEMNEIYRPYFSRGRGVRTCLMPNSGIEKNGIRVQASFIAARSGQDQAK